MCGICKISGMVATDDLHTWELQDAPNKDRPHWLCKRCGSKLYTIIGTPEPSKKLEGFSCNELIAHVVMDA
jgi:hypothetical protein